MSAPEPALKPGRYGAAGEQPVRIAARRCALVQLMARRGKAEALATAMRAAFGLELPPPGHSAIAGDLIALWLQPDAWMLMGRDESSLAGTVKAACGDVGSVVDQSHGRAVLSISGRDARDVLARLCRIDLHPHAFTTGRVAVTPIAELACLLFQRDAVPSFDVPSFDVIVSSSYAGWFVDALTHAAAVVGYEVPDAGQTAELRAGAV